MFEALFRKLRSEAIRLVSQPEQSHERFTPQGFTAAPTHDRGDAYAPARAQDPGGLHSRGPSLHRIPGPLAGYSHGRRAAPVPTALRRSGDLRGHAERHDHGTEVLIRGNPGAARVDGQDAPRAHVPHLADHLKSRGSEPPT